MHSEVNHPELGWIPEIFCCFWKGAEGCGASFLLPNLFALARWCERDHQMLLVPVAQSFGIMSAEEKTSDSGYFFHFISSGSHGARLGDRTGLLAGDLRLDRE